MTEEATDVLILGAGPVGLTLANELARRGVRPVIVDRAEGIREVSKALILHVRTQEALGHVGIMDQVLHEAQPLKEVVVNAYGKFVGSWDLDRIDSPYPHPLILGQNRTQHLLLEQLEKHQTAVRWNSEAVDVQLEPDAARVAIKQEGQTHSITARYVVGCEGSNSLVRKTAGFSFAGERYSGEQFIQADCEIRWAIPSGRSCLFLTAAGYMMVIEMPGGIVRIFISLPDDRKEGAAAAASQLGAVEAVNEQPTLDEIAHHFQRLSGYACKLSNPLWLARYRTSHRYADRFRNGPLIVAGDAGHVHVPIGGQGMNTGIQDAFNLGWKLAGVVEGTLHDRVLDSYNDERHPVAESLIRGTDLAYRGVLHPSKLRQRAARAVGPTLLRSRRIQTFMRNTLEELSIAYPTSPLNLDLHGAQGPSPGERMLDAPVVRAASGASTSLWQESLEGRLWLLVFAASAPLSVAQKILAQAEKQLGLLRTNVVSLDASAHGPSTLIDVLGIAHRRYGAESPALFLIRPDTVVAARAPLEQWEKVANHLRSMIA